MGAGIFYGTNKAPGLNGANNGFTNSPSWSSSDNGISSAFQWDNLGTLLNKPIDDPAVVALGFKPPFANFKQLMGGNATLGQSLRPFPQFTGVSTGGMMNHSGNSTCYAWPCDTPGAASI